jgi:DNA polymerase III delta prime subunit
MPVSRGLEIQKFTVDREEELKALFKNLEKRIPTLIVGKPGVGKTHLLFKLKERIQKQNIFHLYIEKFKPVKDTLIFLSQNLKGKIDEKEDKKIRRMTIKELSEEIILLLEKRKSKEKEFIIIFDHLEELTSSTADILMRLSSLCVIFGATQFIRRIRALRRFFWQFDLLEVEPLSKDDSKILIEKLIKTKNLRIGKHRQFFINQVLISTNGIPLSIVETINRAKTRKKLTKNYIREMFIHASGIKEIDASPFVIFVFALFIVMRFIYRGFGEYQGYALFGALTGLAVFVRFLIYRQMRRKNE